MTGRYLLDTNVLSEPLRPVPSPQVMGRLEEHSGTLATSAVVWSELVYGARRMPEGRRRDVVHAYLETLASSDLLVLAYDLEAAQWHGVERARLQTLGRTPPFADGQIAATAWRHEIVLVTRNRRDFSGFSGIELENWFEPA